MPFHSAHERHYLRRFAMPPGSSSTCGDRHRPGRRRGTGSPTAAFPKARRLSGRSADREPATVFPAGDGWVPPSAAVYRRDQLRPRGCRRPRHHRAGRHQHRPCRRTFQLSADPHGNLRYGKRLTVDPNPRRNCPTSKPCAARRPARPPRRRTCATAAGHGRSVRLQVSRRHEDGASGMAELLFRMAYSSIMREPRISAPASTTGSAAALRSDSTRSLRIAARPMPGESRRSTQAVTGRAISSCTTIPISAPPKRRTTAS